MKKITAMLLVLLIIMASVSAYAAEHAQDAMELTPNAKAEVVYGDLTGDGKVELADVRIALRGVLRLIKLDEGQYAAIDVDGEEGVGLRDVRYILRYALNLINTFPVQKPPAPTNSRVLVAYFSATNTTEKLAQYVADGLQADVYEIIPEIPYTNADLNYGDPSSRTSMEKNDANARPAISGSIANMEQYDIIFLGYPIWFGQAPKIISTFLESYDFTGKTIVPFCTSGSSPIGSSAVNIHNLAGSAKWLEGRRFGGNSSRSEVIEWVNGLELGLNGMPSEPAATVQPSQPVQTPTLSPSTTSPKPSEAVQTKTPSPSTTSPKPSEDVQTQSPSSSTASPKPSEDVQTQPPSPSTTSPKPNDEKEEADYMLNIQIGEHLLTATLEQNSSTDALTKMLSNGPVTIHMQDYANMEKVGDLPESLPRNDEHINTEAGDLILYQGISFVIYYDTNSWSLTRLGKINAITQQELKDILGDGNVTIVLSI